MNLTGRELIDVIEKYASLDWHNNRGQTTVYDATNGNYALGNERFAVQVTTALGRRATPGKSGRPSRTQEPESEVLFDE